MSEIPEGATHKKDGFFYKKECTCWYVYMSGWKPNTVANELRGWAESNLTLIKQDKEMDIDWSSKDAEGFNFALNCKELEITHFYKDKPLTKDGAWECMGESGRPSFPEYQLHTRPKAKEMIYTKEMQEAGELPKVGMMVDFRKCDCEVMTGEDAVGYFVIMYEGEWEVVNTSDITAIDTRTDTEKAIDDLADGISASYSDDQSFKEDAINMLNFIKAGKIHGVTFAGDK